MVRSLSCGFSTHSHQRSKASLITAPPVGLGAGSTKPRKGALVPIAAAASFAGPRLTPVASAAGCRGTGLRAAPGILPGRTARRASGDRSDSAFVGNIGRDVLRAAFVRVEADYPDGTPVLSLDHVHDDCFEISPGDVGCRLNRWARNRRRRYKRSDRRHSVRSRASSQLFASTLNAQNGELNKSATNCSGGLR
jgi:hypothetical protein